MYRRANMAAQLAGVRNPVGEYHENWAFSARRVDRSVLDAATEPVPGPLVERPVDDDGVGDPAPDGQRGLLHDARAWRRRRSGPD